MTMQYPFILPCPICGETPKTFEYDQRGIYRPTCPNCGSGFANTAWTGVRRDETATAWNVAVIYWFVKYIPLKDCPNCEFTAEGGDVVPTSGPNGYYVHCEHCEYDGPVAASIPAACILWNKQAEQENVTTQDKEADQ